MRRLDSNLFTYIGRINRSHGVNGMVIMQCINEMRTDKLNVIFVEISGLKIPYKIEKAKQHHNDKLFLALQDVNSKDDTADLVLNNVFVYDTDINDLISLPNNMAPIIGYTVFGYEGVVGSVLGIERYNVQYCLRVEMLDHTEKLMPYTDEFVASLDHENKSITVCYSF